MTQYIDKSALVAEIERRLKANGAFDEMGDTAWWEDKGMCDAYKSILSFLNTLEVKEAGEEPVSKDLEAEFVLYLKHKFNIPQEGNKLKTNGWSPSPYDLLDIAKHFAQWQKEQMVKEVDLEGISKNYALNNSPWDDCMLEMQNAFKDGFELGLKVQKGE